MWERLNRTDSESLYNAACWRAVTAAVVRATDDSPQAASSAAAEADRAMDWLNKAVAAGYRNFAHMKQDKDLNSLHEREDFNKLVMALEAKHGKNERAWELATDADPSRRDPMQAVALAQQAVAQAPRDADAWNTLGVARYRAGDLEGAVAALQKFRELRTGDAEWSNPFFLTMAHWRLGNKEEARQWFRSGVHWMDERNSRSAAMIRFRAESGKLLGIQDEYNLAPEASTAPATTRPQPLKK